MSYTETGITILQTIAGDAGAILRVANAHPDKVVQCYVNGDLATWQSHPESTWLCRLSPLAATDVVFLLAVDPAEARTNFWSQAYPDPDAGNRLRIRLPQTVAGYRPDDRWRVYLGPEGDAVATTAVFTDRVYPGGRRACGFGSHLGSGFGYDAHEAAGFGANWGLGEFAFDCGMLQWRSGPLPPGAYPVKVTILDAAGNESPAAEMVVELNTYARPARNLAVTSYIPATDTLVLSFTESEDIAHG